MIPSPRLRRAALAALAAFAVACPALSSARAEAPSSFPRTSASGSYLAARHAGGQRDAAAAASYYRAALRGDPRNNELLGRTFLAVLANGEVDEAVKLAERVLQLDKTDRIARLVLGVRAIKHKQYPLARRELAQSIRGPITDLAATLLSAWTMASPSEAKLAADSIDKLTGADWYAIFKDLHAALIADLAGHKKEAAKRFERSYKLDPTALRVVQSYGSFLSRQGQAGEALKIFAAFDEALPRHPLIVEATAEAGLDTGDRERARVIARACSDHHGAAAGQGGKACQPKDTPDSRHRIPQRHHSRHKDRRNGMGSSNSHNFSCGPTTSGNRGGKACSRCDGDCHGKSHRFLKVWDPLPP